MTELERERAALEKLIAEVCEGEKRVLVHGEGDPGARVMLIGEAPGEQETLLRRPFVGRAGKNLDEFLSLAGIERAQLYVTNTVKYRPTKLSAAGNPVNRPPTREEISLFLPWLRREIALVRPQVVVTLGNVPLKALMGGRAAIGSLHGAFAACGDHLLYPMYHPASLIYNRALRPIYETDVRKLADWLKENHDF